MPTTGRFVGKMSKRPYLPNAQIDDVVETAIDCVDHFMEGGFSRSEAVRLTAAVLPYQWGQQ